MKEEMLQDRRRYYLSEFSYFDGDHFVTFNIVDIDTERKEITVAVSDEGKINVCSYDLMSDDERLYFEYGVMYEQIAVDDFEQFEEGESYDDYGSVPQVG